MPMKVCTTVEDNATGCCFALWLKDLMVGDVEYVSIVIFYLLLG